ncbi:uncharacterized protein TNCV_4426541 [Trichonephila clavipes]|nr:uncharacterized protein TNCV_4426541 [Trichonephila clavipes]
MHVWVSCPTQMPTAVDVRRSDVTREIAQRVGQNQAICHAYLSSLDAEGILTERRDQSHPPRCTTAPNDRRIVRLAVMDRAVTSRTIAQQIQSVQHRFGVRSNHSTPFAAEWNVRKASIASLTLDWKTHAFALPMVRRT